MYTSVMIRLKHITVLALSLSFAASCIAENAEIRAVKKAVERSTLNQPDTAPFHMKAVLAPTRKSDQSSARTGEVEIWWMSPSKWRREVRSPEFHQVAIVDGSREWQRNEGEYFPDWLRRLSEELIQPTPSLEELVPQLEGAEVRKLARMTHFSWMIESTNGDAKKAMGAGLALSDDTGLLLYCSGTGWGGIFHDYRKFHNRMVAYSVGSGSPEVTATVTVLEDLGQTPSDFFDPEKNGSSSPLLHTQVVEEKTARKNLLNAVVPSWPPVENGPLEGTLTTDVVVDTTGVVREIGTIVSDNPALNDAARTLIRDFRFKPYVSDGVPIQVITRITMPFKTSRPAGVESFASAREYFERGRKTGFPAASGIPYELHAEFRTRISSGSVETGEYTDIFKSKDQWRREARIAGSRFIRCNDAGQTYQLAEGPDAALLGLVLLVLEPIPGGDTMVESDWKIKREAVGGVSSLRLLTGYESPAGDLDAESARAFWFDTDLNLIKTYFGGLESRRSAFENYEGVKIAREIRVLHDSSLGILIHVKQISPASGVGEDLFRLPGHERAHAFTSEVR